MINELLTHVQRDLARASVHLLDRGLSPSASPSPRDQQPERMVGPTEKWLLIGRAVRRLVQEALLDVAESGESTRQLRTTVLHPGSGIPQFQGAHLERSGSVIAPARWTTWRSARRPSRNNIAWLLFIIRFTSQEIERRAETVKKDFADALEFRSSDSAYFKAEAELAKQRRGELDGTLAALHALKREMLEIVDGRVIASSRLPFPLPRSDAWRRLVGLYAEISDPLASARHLARLFQTGASMGVGAPHLYQRWCGLKLHEELLAQGWSTGADPIPRLLLGGVIEYAEGDRSFQLLIEPRFPRHGPGIHGLRATRGEVTPDLVLMVPESREPGAYVNAYVLDPTLSISSEAHAAKAKYVETLQLVHPKTVAGAKVIAHPMRSWAMAPLRSTKCVLRFGDWRGIGGAVPMNPAHYAATGLRDWLMDIDYLAATSS